MSERIGRNDPCPCGSGSKMKKCCLNPSRAETQVRGESSPLVGSFWSYAITLVSAKQLIRDLPSCLNKHVTPGMVSGACGSWVHFGDAIPDDEGDILVTDGHVVASALWGCTGLHFECPSYAEDDFAMQVTHWMRFPEPPSRHNP